MAYPAKWLEKVTSRRAGFRVVASKHGRRKVRRSVRSCSLCRLDIQGFHADSEHGPSHYWIDGFVEFLPERYYPGSSHYGLHDFYRD